MQQMCLLLHCLQEHSFSLHPQHPVTLEAFIEGSKVSGGDIPGFSSSIFFSRFHLNNCSFDIMKGGQVLVTLIRFDVPPSVFVLLMATINTLSCCVHIKVLKKKLEPNFGFRIITYEIVLMHNLAPGRIQISIGVRSL